MNKTELELEISNLLPNKLAFSIELSDYTLKDKILRRNSEKKLGLIAASKALSILGYHGPVVRLDPRFINWPKNYLGSISHTDSILIAVACRSDDYFSIGIDIENINRRLSRELHKRILVGDELNLVKKSSNPTLEMLKIFSAKEAIYKSIYPLVKEFFGLRSCELGFQEETNCYFIKKLNTNLNFKNFSNKTSVSTLMLDNYLLSVCLISSDQVSC